MVRFREEVYASRKNKAAIALQRANHAGYKKSAAWMAWMGTEPGALRSEYLKKAKKVKAYAPSLQGRLV